MKLITNRVIPIFSCIKLTGDYLGFYKQNTLGNSNKSNTNKQYLLFIQIKISPVQNKRNTKKSKKPK